MSPEAYSAPGRDFTADAIALAEQAAGLGVWEWRMATGNLRWTPGLEPLHGLAPGQFEGTFEHFMGLIHEDDRPRVMKDIQAALEGGPAEFETEFRVLYPDGGTHWILGKGMMFRDSNGAPERMVGIGLDVTDRHRRKVADEILVRSGGILSASLDYAETIEAVIAVLIPDLADHGVIDLLNPDGTLTRLAAGHRSPEHAEVVEALRGHEPRYREDDPRTLTLIDGRGRLFARIDDEFVRRITSDEAHFELLRQLDPTGAIVAPICAGSETLGVMLLLATEGSRVFDEYDLWTAEETGRRAGIAISNARAFNSTREMAEELVRANRAKDEFLGLVSHELRTPITTIAGNADILLRLQDRLTPEQRQQALEDMRGDSERLKRLIENMLHLSRMETHDELELEPTLLPYAFEPILRDFRRGYPARTFSVTSPPDLPIAAAHPGSLEQILGNLLSNAVKYSPPDSPVTIALGVEDEFITISVIDEGEGIHEDAPVFDAFYRAPESAVTIPGLGLGLSVCQRLVRLQGGTIRARRREHVGSEFTFTLKRYSDA